MKYVITDGTQTFFRPAEFDPQLFQRWLQQLGVNVTLANPNFNNGTYKILTHIDNTPTIDARFQRRGDKTETFFADRVECSHAIVEKLIGDYKKQRIDEVYDRAAELLDAQTGRRSVVEIADWPLLKADIKQFQIDNTIGAMLQQAADRSNYDVPGLVAEFAPRIGYENNVIIKRSQHTAAIQALTTHIDVADYDIGAGWPS